MVSRVVYEKSQAKAFFHHQNEKKLSNSAALYRDIIEEQTELICRSRPDGVITFVNDSYCRYFGRTREELIGHSFMPFIPLEDRKKLQRHISTITKKKPVATIEHGVVLPSGELRWQQWIDRAIFDVQGHLIEFQSVGRDITAWKQAEKMLQESEKRYRFLISKMVNGFALNKIIFNESGTPWDSRFLEINPAFEQIVGKKAGEIIGKKACDVFPGTESFWIDKCGQVALSDTAVQFKKPSRLFNRDFEIIAYSPIKGEVATVFTDITERVKIEEALRESGTNFRAIAENSNDGILIEAGIVDHIYVYANGKAADMTGYSIDELLNMGYEDLAHPDEIRKIAERYQSRLAGKPITPCFETIIVKKDGTGIPVEITGSRTLWQKQPAVMVVLRDISLRKRFEEALAKRNKDLEQRVQQRTNVLMEIAEELEEKKRQLQRHKLELEKVNKELVQTNTALSVLARNIDKKRDEAEKKIAKSVSSQIMPLLNEIRCDNIPKNTQVKIDVLNAYLNDMTKNVAKSRNIIASLSTTELKVAVMIKKGFSSDEIARLLHVSLYTVKTHRKNIRRKLNLKNSNINLASYLKLKL